MPVKKPSPVEETEEQDDGTPEWARSILSSLSALTGDLAARVSALETKEQPHDENSAGATEKTTSDGEQPTTERKPKRRGFLSAWDRE